MATNAIALTAVALGLVIAGAAVGTGVQGFSRNALQQAQQASAQPKPESTATSASEQPASASQPAQAQPQATPRYQPTLDVQVTPGVVIFNPAKDKDGAYLRSYPSLTESAIEGVLVNGTQVQVGQKAGDFVAVTTQDGVKGWIHSTMLATVR